MRRFAKRGMIAPILLLALSMIPTSGSAAVEISTVERKGSIKAMWNEVLAATELDWDCANEPHIMAEGGLQGLDAYIIKLPDGSAGQRIEETLRKGVIGQDPVGAVVVVPDIDWYFYDAECAQITNTSMATAAALEKSKVPADAKWVIGFLFAGDPVHFTIEIDVATVVPDPPEETE